MASLTSNAVALRLGMFGVAVAAGLAGLAYVLLRPASPGSEPASMPSGLRSPEDSDADSSLPMDLADAAQVARDSVQDPSGGETTDPKPQGSVPSPAWSASEARDELQRIDRAYQQYSVACESASPQAPLVAKGLVMRCVAVQLASRGRGEVMEGTEMRVLPERPDGVRQFVVGNKLFDYTDAEFPELATLRAQVVEVARSPDSGEMPRPVLDPELRARIDRIVADATSLLAAAVE